MQKISLAQVTPGMMLAYEVTSPAGMVLADAGAEVDADMLRRLEIAGVTKLVVRGNPVPGADMGYNTAMRAKRLEHLFRRHRDDRFMNTLKNMLYKHFTAQP